ncbi:MAG: sensor domain-containing diguanylate cyclase [Candidatus Firestonebacteria bacterium]
MISLEKLKEVLTAVKTSNKPDILRRTLAFGTVYMVLFLFFYRLFVGNITLELVLVWILVASVSFFRVDCWNYIQINNLTKINKQLNYVEQLTTALRSSTKTEDILKLVMKNLTEELRYDRVIIYSLETDERKKELLKPIAAFGIDFNMIKDCIFKLDKALDIIPRVAVERKGYIIKNAQDDYRCSQEFVALLGMTEYIVVPLVTKGATVGVLLADNFINKRPINDLDLVPLTSFSNQVAMTIENAKLYEKVEYLAIIDGLTNVHNHRYFMENLKAEIERMTRYEKEGVLSVIMIDVDHFKLYNDTNGHMAGDAVLIEIGQVLKNLTRKVDLVARYGGEEFVIMLPATQKEGARILAERIRTVIEDYPFEFKVSQPNGKLTVSLGLSTYPEDGITEEALINTADKGLYMSKTSGRNKVSIARSK